MNGRLENKPTQWVDYWAVDWLGGAVVVDPGFFAYVFKASLFISPLRPSTPGVDQVNANLTWGRGWEKLRRAREIAALQLMIRFTFFDPVSLRS